MSNWKQMSIGDFVDFNPSESLPKGKETKKIPMAMLTEYVRKIRGFEIAEYNSGPKFRNGDTLVAKITPCLENGKTAQVDILENNEVAFGSSEFIVLRENQYSINDYIYYLAKSPVFRERAISCMEGTSGRKRVNEGALKRQEIIVPNKNTQQKIAKVLSDLDAKIELNNKINIELEAMAKTLYDYWFVQFDFPFDFAQGKPNANGKPYKSSGGRMVWNEELKRDIPEGWEVKELDEILSEFTKGITTSYVEKSNLINLNQKVNKGFFLERQYFKYLDESIEVPKLKFAKKKDILINSLGQGTLGRIHYFIDNETNIVVDQHLFILRTKANISSAYLYNTLNSKPYQIQIERQITGSTGMQMLNASNLKDLKIIVPNSSVSNQFEDLVSKFYDKISLNEKENQELASLRDWLLPMLMNGQVSVASTSSATETYDGEALPSTSSGSEKTGSGSEIKGK